VRGGRREKREKGGGGEERGGRAAAVLNILFLQGPGCRAAPGGIAEGEGRGKKEKGKKKRKKKSWRLFPQHLCLSCSRACVYDFHEGGGGGGKGGKRVRGKMLVGLISAATFSGESTTQGNSTFAREGIKGDSIFFEGTRKFVAHSLEGGGRKEGGEERAAGSHSAPRESESFEASSTSGCRAPERGKGERGREKGKKEEKGRKRRVPPADRIVSECVFPLTIGEESEA